MTSITGKIACAKRGGPTFLETIRVDPDTEECPRTYVACSPITSADDTVCVKEYEVEFECPIIDMTVIQERSIPYYKANFFEVTEGGFALDDEAAYKTYIAFSKLTTRVDAGQ
jgi:hypothetical protein